MCKILIAVIEFRGVDVLLEVFFFLVVCLFCRSLWLNIFSSGGQH